MLVHFACILRAGGLPVARGTRVVPHYPGSWPAGRPRGGGAHQLAAALVLLSTCWLFHACPAQAAHEALEPTNLAESKYEEAQRLAQVGRLALLRL